MRLAKEGQEGLYKWRGLRAYRKVRRSWQQLGLVLQHGLWMHLLVHSHILCVLLLLLLQHRELLKQELLPLVVLLLLLLGVQLREQLLLLVLLLVVH